MARFHAQSHLGSFAVFVSLCLGRLIRNRMLLVICVCLFVFFIWTGAHHRVITDGPYTLCVAVFTAPNEASAARRQVARETWLSLDDGVKHFFFIGNENLHPDAANALATERAEGEHGGPLCTWSKSLRRNSRSQTRESLTIFHSHFRRSRAPPVRRLLQEPHPEAALQRQILSRTM